MISFFSTSYPVPSFSPDIEVAARWGVDGEWFITTIKRPMTGFYTGSYSVVQNAWGARWSVSGLGIYWADTNDGFPRLWLTLEKESPP